MPRENKKEEIYFIVNTTIHIRLVVYSTGSFLKTFFKCGFGFVLKEKANIIVFIKVKLAERKVDQEQTKVKIKLKNRG